MSGFIRRYEFFPPQEVITQIEGVIIADMPPSGDIQGVGTGVACIVGEFANMRFATTVNLSGEARPDIKPVEIFSFQDMLNKVGGFDFTIGDFGGDLGNGFVEVRNKRFSRLVLVPVDMYTPASRIQGTTRIWRDLPTNQSATIPQPIVAVQAAQVAVSTQFISGPNQALMASAVNFTDDVSYIQATDGAVTAAPSAVLQEFNSASGDFINRQVKAGDILVLGVIGGTGALGANADTYRIAGTNSATQLEVEKLDGTAFVWTTGSALPYRIHPRNSADSSQYPVAFATDTGFDQLSRPIFATIAAGALLTPVQVPPAGTASTWNPLSGLAGAVHPTLALTYDANIHALNVTSNAFIDARYTEAITATISDEYPSRDINMIVTARKTATNAQSLRQSVQDASTINLTRRTMLSPPVDTLDFDVVVGDTYPGVGGNRGDRLDYSWPGATTNIPEAVGFAIATSDGKFTSDGILDVTGDTWLMSVESNLAPERNPGQSQPPVPQVLAGIIGFARGTPKLNMNNYIRMRQSGIAGLRFDRTAGPIFQSGITTSLEAGRKNIMRRRMADFIQDSIARAVNPYSKLPLSVTVRDTITGEIVSFLNELQSPNNPPASRITDYSVDDVSGNTPSSLAKGIYVVIVKVRLTPTADFIVIQTDISEGTVITRTT